MKQRSCRRGRGFALALSLLAWTALGSQRVPNTSIQMPAAPPTFGFTSSNAFPTLNFTNPTVIVSAPGESSRLFIAEKSGRIALITNLAVPTRTTFMDISSRVLKVADTAVYDEQGLLGMEFHPGFATNGYFYLFYTGNATSPAGTGRHDILSRFRLSSTNANQGDTNSETRFMVQYDQDDNHNGGCLRFGPDGYLYVGLGDEGGSYGSWGNSQKIDRDFFSAIMRIDVDRQPGNLAPNAHAALPSLTNYSVPNDNPFVGATNFNGLSVNATNVRSEFWAVGVRNPWRFTFDSETGEMILGHVGQDTLEWINLVTKGANFGWNFFEGAKQWTNSAQIPSGFTFTPPLIQYGHTNGRVCIIGGVVSHGLNVSQLYGAYIYGDYGSGEVFALRHVGTNVTVNSVLFSDPGAVIGTFGVDPSNGDVLYGSLRAGTNSQIKRLIYNSTTNGAPLPPTLANTGVFTNLSTLAVAPGIMPYDINVPFWSDGALKTRWFSVPNVNLMIGYNPTSNWTFPTGTVWIKHFDLELTNGASLFPAANRDPPPGAEH
jgi:glucose/arabinose dehydrogenase